MRFLQLSGGRFEKNAIFALPSLRTLAQLVQSAALTGRRSAVRARYVLLLHLFLLSDCEHHLREVPVRVSLFSRSGKSVIAFHPTGKQEVVWLLFF